MKMIKYNLKTWLKIDLLILLIILVLLILLQLIPNINKNELDEISRLQYNYGIYEGTTPIWKIIGYFIVGILIIIDFIIYYKMLRCSNCNKHIKYMHLGMKYCPYCSKSLEDNNTK